MVKIQIIKPLDTDWNILGKTLRELQYNTWKMANRGIQLLWDYQNFDFAYKTKYGEYFKLQNGTLPSGRKNIKSDLINETADFNYLMYSSMKDAVSKKIENIWSRNRKEILNGERSIVNFKRNIPIQLHNKQMMDSKRNVLIHSENNDNYSRYSINIKLLSKQYAKEEFERKSGAFLLALAVKDKYQRAIVDRLISGEYRLSMSEITYDKQKKKWFLMLAYSFDAVKEKLNKDNILGVDLGVTIPAMLAFNNNKYYRKSIGDGQEILDFKKQIYRRKRLLQRSRSWSGNGSQGHGRKTLMKPLDKLAHKISRYRETKNHAMSRVIVKEAIANNCGTIQMEDLSGISETNLFLKQWTYYDLQTKIINKAREAGIDVILINPKYTSARCNKCGYIHRSIDKSLWRPDQAHFICQNCDYKENADLNAAKNIATKDIENIIKRAINESVSRS